MPGSGATALSIAAASIAQVHFAVTSDGRDVAVKILRPGIEQAFARDLEPANPRLVAFGLEDRDGVLRGFLCALLGAVALALT